MVGICGEQMVLAHSKTNYELPPVGVKEFEPNHSWLEQKQIQSALSNRKTLLEEERVEKWSSLMTAEWLPEKHKAAVTRTGKHWETFGHHSGNSDWLFPEEVLFLMEMNCLECLYGQVPLSVQKGYAVLLQPENGCTIDEYRVFSHLCRAGYRVLRHLPDLTVTAYEKTIRLDQHLKERKTYVSEETTSPSVQKLTEEELLARWPFVPPDDPRVNPVYPERWLPPIHIEELPENVEVTIAAGKPEGENEEEAEQAQVPIEVIDLADTSSEEEESSEESSDSDIEIIHESGLQPKTKHKMEEDDDDDVLEIIEVPVPKKEIIVETIESSDNEEEKEGEEEENSGSESDRSYDGNWKRNRHKKKPKFVRPPSMSNFTFAAVDEFCMEKKSPLRENVNGEVSQNKDGCNDNLELISLETTKPRVKRSSFHVRKSRNEILDLMPTMAGHNSKLMSLDSPDLRLVPDNVVPRQQSYTYSTNALRARVFRQGFRGRRNFHGPRFNSYNPYYNNTMGNFYPNQLNFGGGGLFQAPQLSQMFGGGDMNSVARGVMQIASALFMNLPQNNMSNGVLPYNSRPHFPTVNTNYSQIEPHNPNPPQRDNSNLQHLFDMPQQRNFGTPNHMRFSDNSCSPTTENNQNVSMDISRSSGAESDFDSSDHTFTPPVGSAHRGETNFRSNRASDFRHNRAANFRSNRGRLNRNNQNRRGSLAQAPYIQGSSPSHFRPVDPAYMKPDVPVPGEPNSSSNGASDFIPVSSSISNSKPVEIIDIEDNDDAFVPRGGISNRFQKKKGSKRKLKRMKQMAKKKFLNQNAGNNKEPEIIFLDDLDPLVSNSTTVKQELDTNMRVKMETEVDKENDHRPVKLEGTETPGMTSVKQETVKEASMKVENEAETKVKNEKNSDENSGFRVKVEQGELGQNVRVEIKIESSSDTSSVVSLPIANLVKEEPSQTIKPEPGIPDSTTVKTEAIEVVQSVKTEKSDLEVENKEGIIDSTTDRNAELSKEELELEIETSEKFKVVDISANEAKRTEVEVMDVSKNEAKRTEVEVMDVSANEAERTEVEMMDVSANEAERTEVEVADVSANEAKRTEVEVMDVSANEAGRTEIVDFSANEAEGTEVVDVSANEAKRTEVVDVSANEAERTKRKESGSVTVERTEVDMEGEVELESEVNKNDLSNVTCSQSVPTTSNVDGNKNVSSWAEMKKHNLPMPSFQESLVEEEIENEDDEVRPLLRPKHCKTIGSVLTALQIFSPLSSQSLEEVVKLKISFDLYLPTEFRKSNRGLPQYRIVVFSGSESLPSPAQLREVNSRFQDRVPILSAIVTAGSVVFYTFTDISLPQDTTSYTK